MARCRLWNWLSNFAKPHVFSAFYFSLKSRNGKTICGFFTRASYASWSSSCFGKEYARGWTRQFLDIIRLNPLPLAACNPEVVGSTPPPSIESKTEVFTVFFALQGGETQVGWKFEVFRLPFHWGCLDRLRIQHEEKNHREGVLRDVRVGFHFFSALRLSYSTFPCLAPANPPPC